MITSDFSPLIIEQAQSRDWKSLKESLQKLEPVDISDLIRFVAETEDRVIIFRLLPRDLAADVFSEMDWYQQEELLNGLNNTQIKQILTNLEPDDRARFFDESPSEVTRKLMDYLSAEDRKETLELLGYPESSIGRLMTPDYIAIKKDWTVEKALEHIRKIGNKIEHIETVYVIDKNWKLLDAINLRTIILADSEALIETLMNNSFVSLFALDDQEKAVDYLGHYALPIVPVVDATGILLGSVTFDDLLLIAQEETTEDFYKTASVSPLETSYPKTSILEIYSKRVGWLVILIFVNFISGQVMSRFEELIKAVTVLVFFLPLIIDSGGNAGSQSSTLIIRALATKEIELKNWWKLVFKDLVVSILLGLTMGFIVTFVGIYRGGILIGISLAISMTIVVIVGSLLGTLLPFILNIFKLDPATASSPLITTVADILGVLIFFSVSQAIIGF